MIHSKPNETPGHSGQLSNLSAQKSPPSFLPRWLIILISLITIAALALAGYLYYNHASQSIRTEKYADLKAIADLKIDQIVTWRNEQIHDAQRNVSGYFFRQAVEEYILSAGMDPAQQDPWLKEGIQHTLETNRVVHGYDNVILTSPNGQVLLAANPIAAELEAHTIELISQAIATGQVQVGDFYRCPICDRIHLDIVAPVFALDDSISNSTPIAALILQADAENYLFPLIQSWPTPSQSAETLIARKEGDEVLFLNRLRHISNPPLTFRTPLYQTDLPAAKAILGETGLFDGYDYRGIPVLADLRPIPDSPWFMVTKVDTEEILTEARYRGQVTLIVVAVAVLLTAALGVIVSNSSRVRVYRHLYQAEREQAETWQRFRATLYSIGDAVITTDCNGLVAQMNPVAEQLTGWTEPEAAGKPLDQVFQIINEDTLQKVTSPVERVLNEGLVVGLANHTLLVDRFGKERPIADSGAPIRTDRGEISGVVLVFRDQSEARLAEKSLQESEERYRTIADFTYDWEYWRSPDGEMLFCSPSCERISGYRVEDYLQNPDLIDQIVHPQDRHILEQHKASMEQSPEKSSPHEADFRIIHKDQSIRWIGHTCQFINRADGSCLGLRGTNRDISERKQAEEDLRESRERFRKAILESPFPIMLHAEDGTVMQISRSWCEISGYTPQELATVADWTERAYGERRPIIQGDIDRLYGLNHRIYEGDYTIRTKSGQTRIWEFSTAPLDPLPDNRRLVISMAMDVTERRQAEAEILQLNETLEQRVAERAAELSDLYNNAPCGYHSLDGEGYFVRVNDTELIWLGYPRSAVIGKLKFSDLLTPACVKVFEEHFPELKRLGWVRDQEYDMIRQDGSILPVLLSATAIKDSQGNYLMSRSTIIDHTERRKADLVLRESQAKLVEINQELEAFAYSVSHDLRAPLRALDGFSAALLATYSDCLDEQGQHYLDRIQEASRRMGQLINDLLNLSRVTRRELNRQIVDLSDLALEVAASLQSQYPDLNADFRIAPDIIVQGDPQLLRIVLENLLGNALKFSRPRQDQDGRKARIELGVLDQSGQPVYYVRDNGVGFDMTYVEKLFSPFQRLHGMQEFPGTGIGLATVKRIITRHGGRIWPEAAVDQGATFYFTLGGSDAKENHLVG